MRTTMLVLATMAVAVPTAAAAEPHHAKAHHSRHLTVAERYRHETWARRRAAGLDRNGSPHGAVYGAAHKDWRNRPVARGYRLEQAFYAPRYYVNDYAMYRLARPHSWQRWVRYGNDILLVDVRDGRVLQVVNQQGW